MKTAWSLPPCPALLVALGLAIFSGLTLPRTWAQSSVVSIPELGQKLSDAQAASLSKLAIDGMHREFPNKPGNVVTGPEDVLRPAVMHPAFYGCFDWHSSVHGHWMLMRLLQTNPNHPLASESRQRLEVSLAPDKLLVEAKYFDEKENKSFERMYGWAWLLCMAGELHRWDDPDAQRWREAIRPLEAKIVELTEGYLPRLKHPIRTGVHPDIAFALAMVLDYARVVENKGLEELVTTRARAYYGADRNYNPAYEPSGEDFFSPSLNEADLMRRILPVNEFSKWLTQFLPDLRGDSNCNLLEPVMVSDVTDGKLVHLAGLDLSRSWCMQGIASALPSGDPRVRLLRTSAREHAKVGFQYVLSGHYEGEHWLGTFAVYTLTIR